jgi:flagellar basal-body rod protein FlgB
MFLFTTLVVFILLVHVSKELIVNIGPCDRYSFNFKAKDLDFTEMLNNKMGFGEVNTTNKKHFKMSIGSNEQGVKFRQNVTPSKDGNTVELHVEQIQFSENVMRYQSSLEFLNRKISGLMSAIKGE